jgi:hypothetical protein
MNIEIPIYFMTAMFFVVIIGIATALGWLAAHIAVAAALSASILAVLLFREAVR